MKLSVYYPDVNSDIQLPVLYFLHGRTGNEQMLKQLEIDRIADTLIGEGMIKPLIIVCPNMDNSRGLNSSDRCIEVVGKYGAVNKGRYEDYLIEEVIPFVDNSFYTVRERNARYIGGVSAGGYAALNIGMRHQDLFSKLGGHMPAIDLSYEDEDECYFTDEEMWLGNDPITIARHSSFKELKVFLDDGRNDEGRFYLACKKLYKILRDKGVEAENHLNDGHHNGEYVASNMETYLRFYDSK